MNAPTAPIRQENRPPYIQTLVCVVLLLFLTHTSTYPLFDLLGFVGYALFAVIYGILLSCADVRFTLAPPMLCFISLLSRCFLIDGFSVSSLDSFISLLFACLAALAVCLTERKKVGKSVFFAALSAVSVLFFLAECVLLLTEIYGAFRPELVEQALNDLSSAIAELYRSMLSLSDAENVTQSVDALQNSLTSTLRMSFPSMIASWCMLIAALVTALYKPFVRFFRAEAVCLEGRPWRFVLSTVSVTVFYLSYFIYLLCSLFSVSGSIYITFMNVSAILTYPFAYVGLRAVLHRLEKKLKSRVGALGLTAFLFVTLGTLSGLVGLLSLLLAFIGASAQLTENLRLIRPEE